MGHVVEACNSRRDIADMGSYYACAGARHRYSRRNRLTARADCAVSETAGPSGPKALWTDCHLQ
jgi:hypothetical protein